MSKSRINLLVQKLHVKCWWNWPLLDTPSTLFYQTKKFAKWSFDWWSQLKWGVSKNAKKSLQGNLKGKGCVTNTSDFIRKIAWQLRSQNLYLEAFSIRWGVIHKWGTQFWTPTPLARCQLQSFCDVNTKSLINILSLWLWRHLWMNTKFLKMSHPSHIILKSLPQWQWRHLL